MNQCCQKFIANLKNKKISKSNVCILIAAYTYTCEDTQSQSETGDKKQEETKTNRQTDRQTKNIKKQRQEKYRETNKQRNKQT